MKIKISIIILSLVLLGCTRESEYSQDLMNINDAYNNESIASAPSGYPNKTETPIWNKGHPYSYMHHYFDHKFAVRLRAKVREFERENRILLLQNQNNFQADFEYSVSPLTKEEKQFESFSRRYVIFTWGVISPNIISTDVKERLDKIFEDVEDQLRKDYREKRYFKRSRGWAEISIDYWKLVIVRRYWGY